MTTATAAPLAYNMAGAVAATGMSKSSLERAIRAGKLRAKKSGEDADGNPTGSWVITHDALAAFIEGLVDA